MVRRLRAGRLAGLLSGLCMCLAGAVLFAQDPAGGGSALIGSKGTKLYHKSTCALVKRTPEKSKVELATPAEAEEKGFKPCKTCRPHGSGDFMEPDDAKAEKAKPKGKTIAKRGSPKSSMKKADAAKKDEAPAKTASAPATDASITFSRDIAPIFVGNCIRCHNPQQRRGKFDLTTFEKLMKGSDRVKVITPNNPDASELILRVRGEAQGQKMPPGQNNLAAETIAKLEQWIKAGARLDAGFEATATLESIAPSPEARRRQELAKMSSEERDKKLEETGLSRWKKASAKTTPETTAGKNFLIFSNLPKARAQNLIKALDRERQVLGGLLGPAAANTLGGLEKISVYVFTEEAAYVEFVRSIENREVEQGTEAHGKLNVEAPYLAAADPLHGRDEPAATKKAARSKRQDDEQTGPERTLIGLLAEQMAAAAANAGGKPPRWLTYGLGAYLAAQVEPASPYFRRLRDEAAQQVQLGGVSKISEALGGEGAPETIRAVGFSLCEFMSSEARRVFPEFIRFMLQGQEKLDEAIRMGFGATREEFVTQWSGWVGSRYGRRR